jgi:hypothetical protein
MQTPSRNSEPRELTWVDYIDSLNRRAWNERFSGTKSPGDFAAQAPVDWPAKQREQRIQERKAG